MARRVILKETPRKIEINYKHIEQKALRARAVFDNVDGAVMSFKTGQEFTNIRLIPNSPYLKATMRINDKRIRGLVNRHMLVMYLDMDVLRKWQASAIKTARHLSKEKGLVTFSSGMDHLKYEHVSDEFIRVKLDESKQQQQQHQCNCCIVDKPKVKLPSKRANPLRKLLTLFKKCCK